MLDHSVQPSNSLPNGIGVGYKAQHFHEILSDAGPVTWLEVHAENYMGAGGRPIAQLEHLSEKFALSVHGVGLSIGGEQPLDQEHLARLKKLIEWSNPASFSEHLAWSTHDTGFLNDLLPLPYTQKVLDRVADHIDEVQDVLGRQMLLENPSTYLAFAESEMSETDFLTEITNRTGCGLLLDVNNVFISATNQQTGAEDYLRAFPLHAVGEMHLGGHDEDHDESGAPLLIDSHGAEVVDPVWALYEFTIGLGGPKPTLIEWDTDVPEWSVLRDEAVRAAKILDKALVN